jgi:hypothetical protein
MAFIKNATTFYSFADYTDVQKADQRLFEANEGLTETYVEDMLVRSSERILTQIKDSNWWRSQVTTPVPDVDGLLIINRQNDFTDACVFHSLYYYIIPKIADFSDEENSERQKIDYYRTKYEELFNELLSLGDWYDWDESDAIESDEEIPQYINPRRIR